MIDLIGSGNMGVFLCLGIIDIETLLLVYIAPVEEEGVADIPDVIGDRGVMEVSADNPFIPRKKGLV